MKNTEKYKHKNKEKQIKRQTTNKKIDIKDVVYISETIAKKKQTQKPKEKNLFHQRGFDPGSLEWLIMLKKEEAKEESKAKQKKRRKKVYLSRTRTPVI